MAQFERIEPPFCPGCGRHSAGLCQDCVRWQQTEPLLHHRALFTYNTAMKAFIQQYKGLGDYQLHAAFISEIDLNPARHQVLVPITSEATHYQRRGFDPVLGLFAHLPLQQWLVKHATDRPQASKNRRERLATPQSFTVKGDVDFAGINHVRLLDDLYTTGRTLYHAAAALRDAGFHGTITSFSLIR
ncbi:ComF family protein [Lacticaseibacillus saniviri]|uniref:ComF family protein n=2 Tax=Lacticaseibacillus saniviri TaxID=931533 RepID=UPI001EDE0E8E|nr:ComF family protein [Lacticaseibacillus saniviri]MCG4280997.1 ComF family protein [Lacticaseibacillus saniviri]